MSETAKWTIGTGIGLAGLIVAVGMFISNHVDRRIEALQSQITTVESNLSARLDTLEDQVAENRRAVAAAVIIATDNDQSSVAARLIAAGVGASDSEFVQIMDYLDDAPKKVGQVLEDAVDDVLDAGGDVLEAGGDVIEDIIDIFDW